MSEIDLFKLHVRMIQEEGFDKRQARFAAWLEGPMGFHRRMGQMEFDLGIERPHPRLSQDDARTQPEVNND